MLPGDFLLHGFPDPHGNLETAAKAGVFRHGFQSFPCLRREDHPRWGEQICIGFTVTPADASSNLVKLCQSETVGTIDDQRIHIWNIQSRLDNHGTDEDIIPVAQELLHDGLQFPFSHLAVSDSDTNIREQTLDHFLDGENTFTRLWRK